MRNILLLLILSVLSLCPRASRATSMFRHYGMSDGLSQSTCNAIIQDRTGFMWIGTKAGLNRFDGNTFKVYHAANDGHSLGSGYVRALYEAPDGQIWVGTDRGVWIYDPLSDSFAHFTAKAHGGTMVSHSVTAITGDGNSVYIAANDQGVFRYDTRTHRLFNRPQRNMENIECVCIATDGRVWMGTYGGGLFVADRELSQLRQFALADGTRPLEGDIVSAVKEISPGRMFVGATRHGLCEIDTRRNAFSEIVTQYNGKSVFVRSIVARGDEVWAASEMGLYVYDVKTQALRHCIYSPSDPFSLSDNPLYSVCCDSEGGVWLGAYFGGLNYLPNTYRLFDRFVPQGDSTMSLHGRRTREIVQDGRGFLWIGSEDAGLDCMNPMTGEVAHVAESDRFPNVHGLLVDGDYLWVGTFSYGLKIIDTRTRRVVKSFDADGRPGSLHNNSVFNICKGPDGTIYLATIRGLCRYDRATSSFVYFKETSDLNVNQVRTDSHGNLWAATYTAGVYMYDARRRKWQHFDRNGHSRLSASNVLGVFEDSKGQMWFATQGGGVCRYNTKTRDIEPFSVGGDPIGQTVFQIVEDHNGTLWFTTYAGLVSYNPANGTLRHFSNASLMMDNHFNYNSSFVAPDGSIYLGTLNGMLRFTPKYLEARRAMPRLVATELKINNVAVSNFSKDSPLEKNIVFTRSLTLAYGQNSFSLRVVPLEYLSVKNTEMEYELSGYDRDWQPIRSGQSIVYTQLPPGKYVLRVRMKDDSGQWSKAEYELHITVRPHFLLSVWAIIIYVLVAAWAGWRVWRTLNRAARRRRAAMDLFKREKEKELYASKIQFFTNVAHEIRTPLTLIRLPLGNIINGGKVDNPEVKADLDIMYQNANRLSDLINQLLDFRKAERDGLKLNFEKCDINRLVNDVCVRFTPLMRERHIAHLILLPPDTLYADVDHEGMTKIVSNLMNNAVKYCASRVDVTLAMDADGRNFTLTVKNDGKLVPRDMREKIFQPFFRLDTDSRDVPSAVGTGIGLAMARSLAEQHGGSVGMVDDDAMNVFRLTLPVKHDERIALADDKPLPGADEVQPAADADAAPNKHTVLLVEDHVQLREYEKRRLQADYNVLTAGDGEEAIAVLSDNTVSIIVSDIMMEPMDGLALLKRVKHDPAFSYIPVVLLTAVTSDSAKLEGMENGADAYIVKPFSMDYLAETIAGLLRQRESVRQAYARSPFVSADTVSISTADTDFLRRLKESVQRNIDNSDFNVDMLAAELNMSRTSLNRKIRGTLDISPNNYIRLERLKVAASMLKEGRFKVNEVCYKVGFATPSYFTKCFYQQFGLLPKEFVNGQEGNKENNNKDNNKNT